MIFKDYLWTIGIYSYMMICILSMNVFLAML